MATCMRLLYVQRILQAQRQHLPSRTTTHNAAATAPEVEAIEVAATRTAIQSAGGRRAHIEHAM